MGVRRKAREDALQLLYQLEFEASEPEAARRKFWAVRKTPEAEREYADHLFRSVLGRQAEIDGLIQSVSKNWRVERMPLVDRNVLRLAVLELIQERTAPAVVIDEAIEVVRKFSSVESAAFINGILDALSRKFELTVPAGQEKKNERPKKQTRSPKAGANRRRQTA
ncbi:MAG TPA: transcription antitermination factor NusB [Acidobacteriota bacterium]